MTSISRYLIWVLEKLVTQFEMMDFNHYHQFDIACLSHGNVDKYVDIYEFRNDLLNFLTQLLHINFVMIIIMLLRNIVQIFRIL